MIVGGWKMKNKNLKRRVVKKSQSFFLTSEYEKKSNYTCNGGGNGWEGQEF